MLWLGQRGDDHAERPTLRSVLFGTVLVTLLVLFLLGTALFEHSQRDQQCPVGDGMAQLRVAQNNGATWLDQEAQTAIEAALRKGVGGNSRRSGWASISTTRRAWRRAARCPRLPVAALQRQGWVVGVGEVNGEVQHYVAWRTTKNDAIFYDYVVPALVLELASVPVDARVRRRHPLSLCRRRGVVPEPADRETGAASRRGQRRPGARGAAGADPDEGAP